MVGRVHHRHQFQPPIGIGQLPDQAPDHPLDAGVPPGPQRVGHVHVDQERAAGPGPWGTGGRAGLEPAPDASGGPLPHRGAARPMQAGAEGGHGGQDTQPRPEQLPARGLQAAGPAEDVGPERLDHGPSGHPPHHRHLLGVAVAQRRQHPVAPVQEVEATGPGPGRCPEGVADHRRRNGLDPPSGPSGPPGQVGVLVVGEERRVEQADLVQHGGPQQRPSPAEALHLHRREVVTVDLTQVEVEALAQPVQRRAHGVEQRHRGRAGNQAERAPGTGHAVHPAAADVDRATAQHRQGDLGAGVARRHPHPARPGEPVGHVERPVQRVHGPEVLHPDRTGDVQAVDQHRSQLRVRGGADVDRHEVRLQHQPGRGRPHRGVGLHGLHQREQPSRVDDGVVVDQGHVVHAGPVPHPAVAPLGEAQVGAVLDHGHAGEGGPQLLQGPVDGPVVHQHDLQQLRRVVGGPERVEAPARVPGRVPVEDHDPDPGQVRFRHRHHRRGHHSALTSAPPMDTHA